MSPMDLIELEERRIIEIDALEEFLESFSPVEGVEDKVLYASTPTRTGKRFFDALKKHGVASLEELNRKDPDIFTNEIWIPNLVNARDFIRELKIKGHERGYKYVIDASKLHVKDWTPQHYMTLWKQVIEKPYVNPLCFNDNYHYSLGSVEEYLQGLMCKKDTRQREGFLPLKVQNELEKLSEAIKYIYSAGANPQKYMDFHREIRKFTPKSYFQSASR